MAVCKELLLGQDVFCDCQIDILEYKVVEIRHSEVMTTYVLKSKKSVGQHRSIEVVVYINGEGTIRYLELNETEYDDSEYGLGSFTEGKYFTTLVEAKASFAKTQIDLIDQQISRLTRDLAEAKSRRSRWEKMVVSF